MLDPVLRQFCYKCSMVSADESSIAQPDGGKTFQCVYKVRLRDPAKAANFISALQENPKISAVHLLVDQEHEEVA